MISLSCDQSLINDLKLISCTCDDSNRAELSIKRISPEYLFTFGSDKAVTVNELTQFPNTSPNAGSEPFNEIANILLSSEVTTCNSFAFPEVYIISSASNSSASKAPSNL